jgi:SAM-dependent methyltransferase
MAWVKDFYTKQDEWTGMYSTVTEGSHREQAESVSRRLSGRPGRILELGCGGGQAAMALAEAGHAVIAVDQCARAIAAAREQAAGRFGGRLELVLADFCEASIEGPFDVVAYFDGFGIGSDEDQRCLLRRIRDWLAPAGAALVDVYTPWYWAMAAGREMHFGDAARRYSFDAEGMRMLDTWWPEGKPDRAVTQSLRCYGPADLRLLLSGTGLELTRIEPGGAMNWETGVYCRRVPLGQAMSFLATLEPCRPPSVTPPAH